MRNKFKEYYKPTADEIKEFWSKAIFSFDANLLLNLYRYSENTRKEIIEILDFLDDQGRLWISYQSAFEYQNNRLFVIDFLKTAYDKLSENLNKKTKEIEADLNTYKRHPYLKTEELKTQVTERIGEVNKQLEELKIAHPNFIEDDPILNELTDIFEECIGDSLSDDELTIIYKEGKTRYENKIPPGYMDKDKEKNGNQSLYGDLIIWKELIKKIKEAKLNLIFVTDDLKEDWWYIFNGKTIYPRPELVREFMRETGQNILIYKPEQFLQYSEENLNRKLAKETVQEVETIRKIDETSQSRLELEKSKENLKNLSEEISRIRQRWAFNLETNPMKNYLDSIKFNYDPQLYKRFIKGVDKDLYNKLSDYYLFNYKFDPDLYRKLSESLGTYDETYPLLNELGNSAEHSKNQEGENEKGEEEQGNESRNEKTDSDNNKEKEE